MNAITTLLRHFAAAIGLAMLTATALAAPSAKLIEYWLPADSTVDATISHQAWQHILNRYLISNDSGMTLFKYSAVSSSDRQALKTYLKDLQAIDPRRYPRDEQQAYWINLYNALTVDVVLDAYPVKSIRDLGWFTKGPWDKKVATIVGKKLSLNDIEHGILRPIWKDSRIHYAVNCASFSCPNLSPIAYTSANVEEQLQQAAHDYINSPRGIDTSGDKLLLSSIFKWYRSDFGANEQELLNTLAEHAEPDLAKLLKSYQGEIDYDYNWDLNEAR